MSFNGTEGEFIPESTAKSATQAYRAKNPNGIKARFLGRDKLLELLEQENCMGLRMYFSLDENGGLDLVTVGADIEENDIMDKILDMTIPCPNRCSDANALNP